MPTPPGDPAKKPSATELRAGPAPGEPGLKIALTLPGGISPGTFEAGAVCALLVWAQQVNRTRPDTVVIDVMSGASAGALTALLAARVLLAGDEPIRAFHRAWVSDPSLRALRGRGPWAPLSLRAARSAAESLLFAERAERPEPTQTTGVTLKVALSCLRGFSSGTDPCASGADGYEVPYTRYRDWSSTWLPGPAPASGSVDDVSTLWTEALRATIASASHPLGFSATRLNRSALRKAYEADGIFNLPADPDLLLWYSDGGLVENEPLGSCIATVADVDDCEDSSRLIILVRAAASRVPTAKDPAWSGRTHPRFTHTLIRAFDILAAQTVDADRLTTERVNARIRSTRTAAEGIAELIEDNETVRAGLADLVTKLDGHYTASPRRQPAAAEHERTVADLVETVLRAAGGLDGKQIAEVAIVSTDPTASASPAHRELLNFTVRRRRQAAFEAGYERMLKWLETADRIGDRLPDKKCSPDACRAARAQMGKPHSAAGRRGRIPFSARARLVWLAARTARVAVGDVVSGRRTRRSAP